jgi:hypothetical protein
MDWDVFMDMVRRHRMAALTLDGLTRAGIAPPPALTELAGRDVRAALALTVEAARLLRLFEAAAIPAAIVKGPPLSVVAFGQVGLRQCRDLDILVDAPDAAAGLALLEAEGYVRLKDPPPQAAGPRLDLWREVQKDITLGHRGTGAIVELHHRLTLNPHHLPRLGPRDATRAVQVAGVALPTLPDAELLPYLCAHGSSHAWFRLKWLADIGALVGVRSPDEIQAFHDAASARGVGRAAGQALMLCETLWGHALPEPLRRRLHSDFRVRWLHAIALDALAGPTVYERRFGGAIEQLSQLLIKDGWAFRWGQLRRVWIDWPLIWAVDLPRPLYFLYALAKPFTWAWRRLGVGGARAR